MAVLGDLAVLVVLLASSFSVSVRGQSGFISIDCGSLNSYNDSTTGLLYVPDTGFIETGENHDIPSDKMNSGYFEQAFNLRSFPSGIRNCYSLPVQVGNKYLVRAFFLYANYDGVNRAPQFDLYLGTNQWLSVYLANSSINYNFEILTIASSSSLSVCLVNTGLGTPFISALELRQLKDHVYPSVNSSQSLVLLGRSNVQPITNLITRYPNDVYDRIWMPYTSVSLTTVSTDSSIEIGNNYEPPLYVMKTAGMPANDSSLNISWSWSLKTVGASPTFYFLFHFAELQLLTANQSRLLNISVNDQFLYGPLKPKYLALTTIYTINPQNYDHLTFSVYKATTSSLPPILNAMETYIVRPRTELTTDGGDVDAIMDIKTIYQVKRNWMGDPCAPENLVWEGMSCSSNSSNIARITSLNLSSSGITGNITASLARLTQLESLDLSKNNLSGRIPDFLGDFPSLKFLDLSGNRLTGSIPKTLEDRSAAGVLQLSDAGNPGLCSDSNQCGKGEKKNSKTVVAIVAAVCSVIVILSVGLFVAWKLRYRNNSSRTSRTANQVNGAQTGKLGGSFRLSSFHSDSRQFTYAELLTITSNFTKEIGKGGFGTVYHGIQGNGSQVAVKVLSHTSHQGSREFQTEAQLLTRIHHRNLVPLVGYCNDRSHLALVYEYMAQGSLEDHLSGKISTLATTCWEERLRIAIEAAQGLEYLHKGCKPAIVHRDVKPSNILLTENLEARIADFGLSKSFQNDAQTPVSTVVMGTPGYLDPEYYNTNKLNEKSDVYSFGIVLLELITGQPAINRTQGNLSIVKWVEPRLEKGEITQIVDPRLQGQYDINSAWKAVEIALACTPTISIQRPTMTGIVMLLKECLKLKISQGRTQNSSMTNFNIDHEKQAIHMQTQWQQAHQQDRDHKLVSGLKI